MKGGEQTTQPLSRCLQMNRSSSAKTPKFNDVTVVKSSKQWNSCDVFQIVTVSTALLIFTCDLVWKQSWILNSRFFCATLTIRGPLWFATLFFYTRNPPVGSIFIKGITETTKGPASSHPGARKRWKKERTSLLLASQTEPEYEFWTRTWTQLKQQRRSQLADITSSEREDASHE
jgi:hypothetical protein